MHCQHYFILPSNNPIEMNTLLSLKLFSKTVLKPQTETNKLKKKPFSKPKPLKLILIAYVSIRFTNQQCLRFLIKKLFIFVP